MKKALVFFILMMGQRALADVTSTVGPSGSFPNLKSAFTAINNGTLSGAVRLEITGSFTEPDSAVLNASGSGGANYSSVLIYPTGPGYIIHGNVDKSLIRLDGADHVTIDGRVNQSGQRDLVIENESTAGRCIFLYNSASFNIIRYCIIKGANIEKTGGVIALGTSKFTDGNDDNVIEQCDIGPLGINYPNTAICALSLTGKYNRNLTISNNEIHDFHPSSISDVSYGIFLNPGITSSIISGNSFYQASAYSCLANKSTIVISISDDIDHIISDNYIGGNAPMCAGTWTVSTPAVNYKFIGISVTGFGVFSITGNTIKNFFWQTSNTNQSEGSLVRDPCHGQLFGNDRGPG